MECLAQVTCISPFGYGRKPTSKVVKGMKGEVLVDMRGDGGDPEFICANMNNVSMKLTSDISCSSAG